MGLNNRHMKPAGGKPDQQTPVSTIPKSSSEDVRQFFILVRLCLGPHSSIGFFLSSQEWIKTGAVDFGFVTPPAVTDLETMVIKSGEMFAILSIDHPLAAHSSIHLEEIVKEPYILMEEGHYSEPLNAFRCAGLEPNIKYTIHDDYAIMTMVEAGLGVSILAELILRRTNFNIAKIPIEPPVHRTLAIGYKDKHSLPIASQRFIEYLKDHINELP